MPRPKAKPDNMTEEAKAKRREYYKKWRAANRDKMRASQRRYWERLAARASAEIAAAGGDPAEDQNGELIEDQTATEPSSSGTDPEELSDDQLREMVTRKREQVKWV